MNGRSVINPQSFQWLESAPVKPLGLVNSVHTGLVEASGIIFFVLIIGGTFGILVATGAIEALIVTLSRLLRNQEKWLIPIMMLFFAAGGSLMGMEEETIPYIAVRGRHLQHFYSDLGVFHGRACSCRHSVDSLDEVDFAADFAAVCNRGGSGHRRSSDRVRTVLIEGRKRHDSRHKNARRVGRP